MSRRLFWLILAFIVFGLVVLSSASIVQASKQFGSASYFLRHQILYGIVPGLIALLILRRVPYERIRTFALPLLIISLGLMGLVFVPRWGVQLKGATSWIGVFGFTFQPAEVLKLALIAYLAAWLGGNTERLKTWHFGLAPLVLVMGAVCALLVMQPDLGTLGVVMAIAAGLYFTAGAPLKQTALIGTGIVVLVVGFAALSPERWSRITTLFNPAADARGAGWQLNQSLIAIGSGGVWGKGYGESTQKKLEFLPEPIGDSIFAVLVEELGLVGGFMTLGLFGTLVWMLIGVARRAPDGFAALFVMGMCLWISVQAVVNIAAVTGLAPLTGIPLPFISYGGTAMISMLAGLGIVLNIAERE